MNQDGELTYLDAGRRRQVASVTGGCLALLLVYPMAGVAAGLVVGPPFGPLAGLISLVAWIGSAAVSIAVSAGGYLPRVVRPLLPLLARVPFLLLAAAVFGASTALAATGISLAVMGAFSLRAALRSRGRPEE